MARPGDRRKRQRWDRQLTVAQVTERAAVSNRVPSSARSCRVNPSNAPGRFTTGSGGTIGKRLIEASCLEASCLQEGLPAGWARMPHVKAPPASGASFRPRSFGACGSRCSVPSELTRAQTRKALTPPAAGFVQQSRSTSPTGLQHPKRGDRPRNLSFGTTNRRRERSRRCRASGGSSLRGFMLY